MCGVGDACRNSPVQPCADRRSVGTTGAFEGCPCNRATSTNVSLCDAYAATSATVAPAAASSAFGSAEKTASWAPAAAQTMS
jgi:hypothetical protein